MSAHTPGPWGIPDVGTATGRVMISQGGPHSNWKGMIAEADAGGYARSQSEGLANAKLIAAAPILLQFLREAVNLVPESHDTEIWLENARAAIAKAAL